MASRGSRKAVVAAGEAHGAECGVGPEHRARGLGAAGAEQAREADDLARAHLEADVAHPAADLQVLDVEQLAADLMRLEAEGSRRRAAGRSARSRPSMAAHEVQPVDLLHRRDRRPCGRRA